MTVPGLSAALAVSSGDCGTCALANGGVMCWGCGVTSTIGSMGFPQVADSATPVGGGYPGAKDVSIGTAHHCIVTATGSVACSGSSLSLVANPNIGLNTSSLSSYFNGTISGYSVSAVSAGDAHTCALTSDGGVLSWGSDSWGQLGHLDYTVSTALGFAVSMPYPVAMPTAVDVSAGWTHSCAVLANGSIMCWGGNWSGQLGDGTTSNRLLPAVVSGIGATSCSTRSVAETVVR